MLSWVISSIISEEYESRFGWDGKEHNRDALLLEFRLKRNDDNDPRYLQILIWGPFNYVGVYVRVANHSTEPAPIDADSWHLMSYHDSCWRSDGIERLMSIFCNMISGINTIGKQGWNTKRELTDDEIEALRSYITQRDNGGKPPMSADLQSAFDEAKKLC